MDTNGYQVSHLPPAQRKDSHGADRAYVAATRSALELSTIFDYLGEWNGEKHALTPINISSHEAQTADNVVSKVIVGVFGKDHGNNYGTHSLRRRTESLDFLNDGRPTGHFGSPLSD